MRLRDISEGELLARVFPVYAGARPARLGLGPGRGRVTTPRWSARPAGRSSRRPTRWCGAATGATSGRPPTTSGVKVAAQNLADVAAMGAVPTALLVSLAADPDLEVEWAVDLARGIASLAEQAGAPGRRRRPVVGAARGGRRLGDRPGGPARARAGAAVGGAGGRRRGRLRIARAVRWWAGPLRAGRGRPRPRAGTGCRGAGRPAGPLDDRALAVRALMRHHRAPVPPWRAGPLAAAAGAHALVDVSDGLVTDLGRVAAASGVSVDLDGSVLRERYAAGPLALALGPSEALHQVLAGGEEHSLVGAFADEASLPGPDPDRGEGRRAVAGHRPGRWRRRATAPRHRRRRGAGRAGLGPLRPLTGIRHPARRATASASPTSSVRMPARRRRRRVATFRQTRSGRRGQRAGGPRWGAARSAVRQGVSA